MKYKIINENILEKPLLDIIMENRNILHIPLEDFLKPTRKFELNMYDLINFKESILKFKEKYKDNKYIKVGIIWDCDCDGFTSGAFLYNFLHENFPTIELVIYFHSGKAHGISDDIKLDEDLDLLFVVDGGSNDYEQHKELKNKGLDIIILDHHSCDRLSEDAIVVNNKLSEAYSNKNLSGVGIVYKYCLGLAKEFKIAKKQVDKFLDLVAIGNIGDSMDMRELETRYYAIKGLKKINNPLIKQIIKKREFDMKGEINFYTVAFYIVPLFNAIARVGTKEDKEMMIKALISDETVMVDYKKRGQTEPIKVTIQEEATRLMSNAKSRQDTQKKKGVEILSPLVERDPSKIVLIDTTELKVKGECSGLIANVLGSTYRKPIMLYGLVGDKFIGSARGWGVEQFKTDCANSNLFEWVEGHEGAFGFCIKADNIEKVKEYFNEFYAEKDFISEKNYNIDKPFSIYELDKKTVMEVGKYKSLWSKGIDEPLFLIEDIRINKKDIELKVIGKEKRINFRYGDIFFNKRFSNEEEFEEFTCKDRNSFGNDYCLDIKVIGKFTKNTWKKSYAVVEIIDFESKKVSVEETLYF
ncbi:DHH family phosphoesterase [Clostridium perfringens]|nr:DHH family phosphoesterase [Clostridium perfringens]MDK0982998.1 DHH family phosphoesterase [Clostridium perfringens]